jgi:hypothetical protein
LCAVQEISDLAEGTVWSELVSAWLFPDKQGTALFFGTPTPIGGRIPALFQSTAANVLKQAVREKYPLLRETVLPFLGKNSELLPCVE